MVSHEEFRNYFTDKRIVLVGNSRSILNEKRGKFVDSHDIVVRFNMGLPFKYTEYVGERTDVWSMVMPQKDKFFFHMYNILLISRTYTLWPYHNVSKISEFLQKDEKLYILPSEICYYAHKKFHFDKNIRKCKIYPQCEYKRPTSGGYLLYYLINFTNYKSITLIGFDCIKSEWNFYTIQYSYPRWVHDQKKEEKFITGMVDENRDIKWVH